MIFAEGMRKEAQERRANIAEYLARLERAHLTSLDETHYSGFGSGGLYSPITKEAWQLHKKLLKSEGALSPECQSKIASALKNIELKDELKESIERKMSEILEELPDHGTLPSAIEYYENVSREYLSSRRGMRELKLIAMQRLEMMDTTKYKYLYKDLAIEKFADGRSAAEIYLGRPMD